MKKLIKNALLWLFLFIATLVVFFYISPTLFQKSHPFPETPELKSIRDNYNQKGYMTEDEVEKLNRIREDHIESLKANADSEK